MTLHKHAHTGLVTPQLPQPLLTAVLRVIAMLVSSVRSTLQMITRRPPVNATQAMPADLPRATSDTSQQAAHPPAAQHRSPIALILSSAQSARPSKDEGVLTAVSYTSPSLSVSHATRAIHLPLPSRWRQAHSRNEGELPPSVRSTGGGGSPRLRGETEGASRHIPRSVGCILMHLFASAAPRCIKMHPTRSTP